MRKPAYPIAAIAAFAFGLTLAVAAQNNGVPPATAKPDQQFVREAVMGGTAEVQLGEIANDKGSTEGVKAFGRRMVLEHGRANEELRAFALHKEIELAPNLDPKHKAMIDRLSTMSGMAFDRAYAEDMVNDHVEAVAAFQRESESGQDPELKSWAARTRPTLEDHLREIRGIQKDLESGRIGVKSTN